MFFLKRHWADISLGKKMITVILLSSFLAFLGMSAWVFGIAKDATDQEILSSRQKFLNEGLRIAENACAYLKGVADYCNVDSNVHRIVSSATEENVEDLATEVFSMFQAEKYVLSIAFYNTAGTPLQYMAIDGSSGPLPQGSRAPFRKVIGGESTYAWEYAPQDAGHFMRYDNSPKLCLWRVVKSSNNARILGAICVTMDVRRLFRYEMPYTSAFPRELMLMDIDSGQIATNYTDVRYTPEDAADIAGRIGSERTGLMSLRHGVERLPLFFARIANTPMYALFVPSSAHPFVSINRLGTPLAVMLLVAVLVTLGLLAYVSKRLTKPLDKLVESMEEFTRGNFDIRLSFDSNDDIGRLGKTFNRMVKENKELIEKTYVAELKARDAEFMLLQSQINPHFLYNVINSMHWQALKRGEKELAEMAYSLARIFRICLSRGESRITVDRECELVGYYLKLQKSRYGDRIDYDIRIEDGLGDKYIPKLIIQPLVENSVVHGAEDSLGSTFILTSIRSENGNMIIEVSDNGSGIPSDVLEKLPDGYQSRSADGNTLAIRNIHERLNMTYGERCSFEISSRPNEGTLVRIALPLEEEKP